MRSSFTSIGSSHSVVGSTGACPVAAPCVLQGRLRGGICGTGWPNMYDAKCRKEGSNPSAFLAWRHSLRLCSQAHDPASLEGVKLPDLSACAYSTPSRNPPQ